MRSCGHVDNGDGTSTYKCSSTYSGGGNNGGGIDFSVLYDGRYADGVGDCVGDFDCGYDDADGGGDCDGCGGAEYARR